MQNRKRLPKTALPRVFFIDREIASGSYPNAPGLAKKYETSVASINRDIELMRYQLNAPIEYSALHRGFFYSEKTFRLPAGYASADHMLALGMSKNLLALYQNSPLYQTARDLLDGITGPLDEEGNTGWYENRIIVPQVASVPVDTAVWDALISAIKTNRVVGFEYRGEKDRDYRNRRVQPYQLLFDTGAWFLFGHAEDRKEVRMFALSRMKNVIITENAFVMPGNFDYRAWAEGSFFGLYLGNKSYKFSIAVSGDSVQWAAERRWAADQKVKKTADGIILSFTSHQFDKVLHWVLGLGVHAKPLAPAALVKAWEDQIREMYRTLKKS